MWKKGNSVPLPPLKEKTLVNYKFTRVFSCDLLHFKTSDLDCYNFMILILLQRNQP